MSQDITVKELINQFQREISSAVHDLGAVSAFSKKLPQCQVDQLNREFLRLSTLLEEVDKKIKRASSKISQGNEQWGDGSFSTISSSNSDLSFVAISSRTGTNTTHKKTVWELMEKPVALIQIVPTLLGIATNTPTQDNPVTTQQPNSSFVQYKEPNSCSLDDKIDPEKSPAVQEYESMPGIARVMEPEEQLGELLSQQKEAEAERKKKELEVVERADIAAGSPPPDPT